VFLCFVFYLNHAVNKKGFYKIAAIIILGLVTVGVMSAINGTWQNTSFDDFSDDSDTYNLVAHLLLDRWSFHDENSLFVGVQRRSPGYPIFLAIVYFMLGDTPITAYIVHGLLFVGSIILLWRLALLYIPPPYSWLPPMLLALSWPVALLVIGFSSELISLFLLLLQLFLLQKFIQSGKPVFALGAGAALSWFLLIKPAALYLVPLMLALIVIYSRLSVKKTLFYFLIIPVLVVGTWMTRSLILFDTWQIQSGSFVVGYRGLEVTNDWDRTNAALIGGVVGDFFADKYLPGYANNPEPYRSIDIMSDQHLQLGQTGLSEAEREKIIYKEASNRFLQNPAKFVVFGITGLLRQNTPLNHKGRAITQTFAVGGYENISDGLKTSILLGARLLWYIFLSFVLYGAVRNAFSWKLWGMILIWVFGYNLLYAFFTHNEARYMIPLFPYYYLLFTIAIFKVISSLRYKEGDS
jgi:hypothetical protein